MLIPSIDIQGGEVVQLIGGEEKALSAGAPRDVAARFGRLGPVAVIDLDAAMGTGSNREAIAELCGKFRCRVGGGIRDIQTARWWLDAGVRRAQRFHWSCHNVAAHDPQASTEGVAASLPFGAPR